MILVLRALGVGDLATAVPALRGLRAAFADHPLVLAAPGWLEPMVDLVGGIDRVVRADGLDPFDWPGTQPYWAVNLHGRGPRSHRLLQGAEPVLLRAFACPEAGHTDGPAWVDDEHEVHRWCRLLDWYGVPCDPADLGLRLPEPHRLGIGLTLLHPG
ncbi:glycosyltransferase family 9 protein, partial [Micromonospora zhanjiangensis]